MTNISKNNALLTEKGVSELTQDEKIEIQTKKYLKKYEGDYRNPNGLTILGGKYSKGKVLIDFDMLEFRKNGEVLNYIFLNEKQREAFIAYQDDNHPAMEILYGGGAGGGKSFLLGLILFINCIMLEGSSWFVGRKVLKDVKLSTIAAMEDLMIKCGFSDYIHKQDTGIYFKNGSYVKYSELQNIPSQPNFDRLGSFEYTGVFIDEAGEVVGAASSRLTFTLRNDKKVKINKDGTKDIIWEKIGKKYFSANPCKNFLFTDFYIPWEKGELTEEKMFVQALPIHNEFLGDKVLTAYANEKNETMKQIFYYGNWHFDNDPASLFGYSDLNQMFSNNLTINSDINYIACDVSGTGADKSIILVFAGYRVIHIFKEDISDSISLSDKIKEFEKQYKVKREHVVVDANGIGAGTADLLEGCVRFMGGSKSIEKKEEEIRKINGDVKEHTKIKYFNDRSACFIKLSDIVKKGGIYFEHNSYKEEIINELSFIKEIISTSDTIIRKVISKEQIKKMLSGKSPDFADAISMRMVFDFDIEEEEVDYGYGEEGFSIFYN